ncbi:MAG: tol-pal system protein YbgF [Gemmatimonadaceae bacterium]
MTSSITLAGSSRPRPRARPLTVLRAAAFASLAAAGACATRSDVLVLQNDLRVMRMESLQADSARRVQLEGVIAALGRTQDSLRLLHAQVVKFQGDSRGEMYALGQQLIQIQELTGQSQRRLQELRGSLEQRAAETQAPVTVPASPAPQQSVQQPAPQQGTPQTTSGTSSSGATGAAATPPNVSSPPNATSAVSSAAPAGPGPNQLFQLALDQLRRGSAVAARSGFQDLLRQYPNSDVAPEAQFYIAQSFETEGSIASADSAYGLVVSRYPQSTRAPSALYKRALALQAQGKVRGARAALDQVIRQYPRSDEAVLARDRLRTLK